MIPASPVPFWRAIPGLALAAGLGWLASYVHMPLAWVLGPMIVTALVSVTGYPVVAPALGRRFGQAVVGTSIGLNITAAALDTIVMWAPWMVVTALVGIVLAAVLSVPMSIAGKIDHKTAYFSLTPGGLSEMANIGVSVGAEAEPIAVSQAIRVALLVCLMPPLIIALGIDGGLMNQAARIELSWFQVTAALAAGLAGVTVTWLLRFNNPWTVGAILGTGFIAALGLLSGRIPGILFAAAQFLIGVSIGARFRRESLVRLPRVFLVSALFTIALAALLFAYAGALTAITGLDLASVALGSSPGGMAEMALTAQVLHLNVALVIAFQVIRAFFVNGFSLYFYRIFNKIGLFSGIALLMGRRLSR
ncbi:AbrB family transcriptional regulator [Microvirga sp. TS319]|uniref:AbrB family transcriptional regulator n=1 Tax=Microvirga sp. TS319 TaxID=3241165 RepID=UPI003519E5D3